LIFNRSLIVQGQLVAQAHSLDGCFLDAGKVGAFTAPAIQLLLLCFQQQQSHLHHMKTHTSHTIAQGEAIASSAVHVHVITLTAIACMLVRVGPNMFSDGDASKRFGTL
jgi:hypothetical protein